MFDKRGIQNHSERIELREQADYEDFYEATLEEAADVFEQATKFISAVEAYLRGRSVI